MTRTFRILAATDGSPSACAALATAAVFPWPEPSRARAAVAFGASLSMRPALRVAARRVLEAEAESAQRIGSGWHATTDIRFGIPLDTLLHAAANQKADALVVGARTTRRLERALLGSVAAGALNHSRIPVLVVP